MQGVPEQVDKSQTTSDELRFKDATLDGFDGLVI